MSLRGGGAFLFEQYQLPWRETAYGRVTKESGRLQRNFSAMCVTSEVWVPLKDKAPNAAFWKFPPLPGFEHSASIVQRLISVTLVPGTSRPDEDDTHLRHCSRQRAPPARQHSSKHPLPGVQPVFPSRFHLTPAAIRQVLS